MLFLRYTFHHLPPCTLCEMPNLALVYMKYSIAGVSGAHLSIILEYFFLVLWIELLFSGFVFYAAGHKPFAEFLGEKLAPNFLPGSYGCLFSIDFHFPAPQITL